MSVRLSNEEAAVLYRYATGSSFAPTPEAVEAGAVPSDHQDAIDRLAKAASAAAEPEAPAEEKSAPSGARSTSK